MSWNWPSGVEDENVKSFMAGQTRDKRQSEKLPEAFSSGELKCTHFYISDT